MQTCVINIDMHFVARELTAPVLQQRTEQCKSLTGN